MSMQSDVALTEIEAEAWFTDDGWSVESHKAPLQVFTDRFATGDFLLSRIWHTPVQLISREPAFPRPQIMMFIPLVERIRVETTTGGFEIETGDVLAVRGRDLRSITTTVASAHFCIGTGQHRLRVLADEDRAVDRVLRPNPAARQTLVVTATSWLNTPLGEGDLAIPAMRRGLEQLLEAVWITALEAEHPRDGDRDLVALATHIVRDRASDPEFSVAELTTRLNVSTSQLHRSFSSSGTTPGHLVRETRLSLATDRLDDTAGGALDLELIARSAGFRSARSMRRAFASSPSSQATT
ncbi:helix-turn-helix domain-containing protein [Pseudoclavibacter sp. RFBA6]|uniref:AraC family transcriptional regulator n=1 Tax=Pseudoclavibacter sp. RFBA6 TaxID=2080573 RepID=UPI000CE790EB|nr:helix-turn-helix domain-containing protein [Pseudoclavibacter sp. RFBA6]